MFTEIDIKELAKQLASLRAKMKKQNTERLSLVDAEITLTDDGRLRYEYKSKGLVFIY